MFDYNYVATGIFSRTAVNFHAGSKTTVSNIIMSIAVMLTLLFLIPLFRYTPLVVLASIIINAMLGLIKYQEVYYMWKVDKFDFLICMASFFGVIFSSVETGLILAVHPSLTILFVSSVFLFILFLGLNNRARFELCLILTKQTIIIMYKFYHSIIF